MQKFLVKWIVEGEMLVEAASAEAAEAVVQQHLVATITNADKWPQELGAQGIQGAAVALENDVAN